MLISILLCVTSMFFADSKTSEKFQVHLSVSDEPGSIMVNWITKSSTAETFVKYGIGTSPNVEPSEIAEGTEFSFLSSRLEFSRRYSHRVLLRNLKPDSLYWYQCGGPVHGWSTVFTFKTFPSGEGWSPQVAMIGDLGLVNARILPLLVKMASKRQFSLIAHVGDIAYNMEMLLGTVGDEYFEKIEPIAALVPYMISPGNHDSFDNFTNIKNRFSMPGQFDNIYYTFSVGPMRFISISTELYYESDATHAVGTQYRWLEEVLIQANKNRKQHPWIIIYGHRPMYCSIWEQANCLLNNERVRIGSKHPKTVGLEDLLYKYKVDLAFWGHAHVYERSFPVFNSTVYNGSSDQPYLNPQAPVHLTVGAAGCWIGLHNFRKDAGPWSAFRSQNYGFSLLTAVNKSHIHLQYIDQDNHGALLDDVWIVQKKRSSFL